MIYHTYHQQKKMPIFFVLQLHAEKGGGGEMLLDFFRGLECCKAVRQRKENDWLLMNNHCMIPCSLCRIDFNKKNVGFHRNNKKRLTTILCPCNLARDNTSVQLGYSSADNVSRPPHDIFFLSVFWQLKLFSGISDELWCKSKVGHLRFLPLGLDLEIKFPTTVEGQVRNATCKHATRSLPSITLGEIELTL